MKIQKYGTSLESDTQPCPMLLLDSSLAYLISTGEFCLLLSWQKYRQPSLPSLDAIYTSADKLFKSKLVEFRIICTSTPQDTKQIFICGEDEAIYECPTNCLLDAFI